MPVVFFLTKVFSCLFKFIWSVLICCVVEESVCKGAIKSQCLNIWSPQSLPKPNYAYIFIDEVSIMLSVYIVYRMYKVMSRMIKFEYLNIKSSERAMNAFE